MAVWQIILTIILIVICAALTVIILFQEGKSAGLGSLSGQTTDTYYTKNKGRTKEGRMVKITTLMVVIFFVLSAVLNIGSVQ